MPKPYLEKILTSRVYDVAKTTPLDFAKGLSKRLGHEIYLKREDLQPVFSFKIRGAYNKIAQLTDEEKKRGVVAASAGNHAQGVAMGATKLGVKSIIVMPKTTPPIKVESVRNHGGKAVLHGDSYDDAAEYAQKLVEEKGMVYVHPFDDPAVIAGQGTVGMEILHQHPRPLSAVFVPVGGGGLVAGVAAYIKQLRPDIKVIGVEPADTPTLHSAMKAGRRVILPQVGLFADGVAVKQIGKETFRVAKELVDEVVLVNTDEICAAIKDIFDDTRSIAEPAGALAVAGLKKYLEQTEVGEDKTFACVVSGANMNFDRLRHVSERAEIGERKEALYGVTIPEKPGSFKKFCKALSKRPITEFNYRYADNKDAHVFVGVKLSGGENERQEIYQELVDLGYPIVDMTDNEIAKNHVRYMVGGHGNGVENERLFKFEFPEKPGALLAFLSSLGTNWNISMFHYRNHGAAYGRVLCAIQVPKADNKRFKESLDKLGYYYEEQSDNPAYKLFLS